MHKELFEKVLDEVIGKSGKWMLDVGEASVKDTETQSITSQTDRVIVVLKS